MDAQRDVAAFEFRTILTADVTTDDRARMHALFDANYRQANHPYLDKSLTALRHAAIAIAADGRAAGFALGDLRVLDLPRLPATTVAMAGICCVSPDFRRRGLFGALETRAMAAGGAMPAGRILTCGRIAHPASMRTMAVNPTVVPRRGVELTPWQREVGQAIADAYGAPAFDPRTFVCGGTGVPIGYPVMEIDVTPEEWIVFEHVDRDRGDSLLGLAWRPDAPEGW
ncbi:MAG: hypothetical protein WEC75_03330 [Dehalococcoidia bacterium]